MLLQYVQDHPLEIAARLILMHHVTYVYTYTYKRAPLTYLPKVFAGIDTTC